MFRRQLPLLIVCAFVVTMFQNALFAQSIWKEPKKQTWKTATGAEDHERLLWESIKAKEWLAVESHISSTFVYMNASGTKDKAQWVQELRNAPVSDFVINDANVTSEGIDAIVTHTLTLKRADSPSAVPKRVMSVWQQQKSGWVLIAMTEIASAGTGNQ